ncbi:hypothetical protein K2173_003430 [Erythroxylum novogranatense]|uniref:Uncharacterized protein n=1 Tax=Erythroxylum novogranatense TaxID=1862640 RepID=A0AAV8S4E5_9ROSI|nr:hypothetical protein K2173_003430 [Erythroxylum novogranatense]
MEVAKNSNQMNVKAELHLVLDEEEPKKCRTSEMQEGNGRDPSLSLKETPILDESMEHSEVDESVEQSEVKELPILDEEVRVGPPKENDSSIDSNGSVLNSDAQQVEVKELDIVNENGVVSRFEGLEDVVTQLQNHGDYDDHTVDENGVESGPQGMEKVVTQLQNHGHDDLQEEIDHSLTTEGPEERYNSDQMKGSETHKDPVTGPQFALASVELDVVASELLPISSTASNLSANKQDMRMENDWKLIEENAKVREMVEKLIEAGQEQLCVISNLTGRVKNLEKKLSKKKKTTRTTRHKTAMVPGSCAKPSNGSRREAF